jgi:hypothetical protein
MQITFKPNKDKPQKKVKDLPDKLLESKANSEETPKQKVGFVVDEVVEEKLVQDEQLVQEYTQEDIEETVNNLDEPDPMMQGQYYLNYLHYPGNPSYGECPGCPGHKPGWENPDYPECPEEEPETDYPDYPEYPDCPEEEPDYDYPGYPGNPECPEEEPDYDYPEYPECPGEEPDYDYPEYPDCPEEEPDYDCPQYPNPEPGCNGHRCEPYPFPGNYYPLQCLGYAYIPWQRYGRTYPAREALKKGTMFPELYSPYFLDRKPPVIPEPYLDYNQRPPKKRR